MYHVTLKHIPTGEIQVCPMDGDYDWWMWAEGNWSCDCNRELEFRQAKGLDRWPEEEPVNPDKPWQTFCKGSKEYTVVEIKSEGGVVLEAKEPSDSYVIG